MLDRVASRDDTYISVSVDGAREALQELGVGIEHDPRELESIPRRGRVIVVANHPHGALDGLIAIALLGGLRRDFRIIASEDLCALPELAEVLLPVAKPGRTRRNEHATRCGLRWLEQEGALLVFPAGEVSRFDPRARCVTDSPWSRGVAMVARTSRSPVIPMHISGGGGLPWMLRQVLPSGMLRRHRGARVPVRFGEQLAYERLRHFNDEALSAHLRVSTYLLARGGRPRVAGESAASARTFSHPLAPAGAAGDYSTEIARLPAGCRLHEQGDLQVYIAPAGVIPNVLDEIGRLRESGGRALGAGTGRARDLDELDAHYEHLFAWDRRGQQLLGAFRLGRVDQLRHAYGRRGLHSASLFRFRRPFFQLLGQAVELGRGFVREDQQDVTATLALLWKGIGAWCARFPRYARLLGTVSFGSNYRELSRDLLVEFLRSHCSEPLFGGLVRGMHPLSRAPVARTMAAEVAMLGHIDALAPLLEDIEGDGKGVPPLLRTFLRSGSRVLAFNHDTRGRGAIDCLFMTELR